MFISNRRFLSILNERYYRYYTTKMILNQGVMLEAKNPISSAQAIYRGKITLSSQIAPSQPQKLLEV